MKIGDGLHNIGDDNIGDNNIGDDNIDDDNNDDNIGDDNIGDDNGRDDVERKFNLAYAKSEANKRQKADSVKKANYTMNVINSFNNIYPPNTFLKQCFKNR